MFKTEEEIARWSTFLYEYVCVSCTLYEKQASNEIVNNSSWP